MRPILISISAMLLCGFSLNPHIPTPSGTVKSIHEANYSVETKTSGTYYNMIDQRHTVMDMYGKVKKQIEESCFWWVYQDSELKYNASGQIEQTESFDTNNELVVIQQREYDTKGQLITDRYTYPKDTTSDNHYTYVYDSKGNLIEQTHFNNKAQPTYSYTSRFDAIGNETETLEYDGDGVLTSRKLMQYNDAGQVIEKSTYDPMFGLQEIAFFKYNYRGLVTSKLVLDSNGEVLLRQTNTYSHRGDMTAQVIEQTGGHKVVLNFQYIRDDRDNVTQVLTTNEQGNVVEVLERTIEYW